MLAAPFRALGLLTRIALALLLAAATVVVGAGALPLLFGYESLVVQSGSMEPTLRVGALAVVRPVPIAQLQVGDVITFRAPGDRSTLVTHRLVGIEPLEGSQRQFRTKGDANQSEELILVDQSTVLGILVYSVPYAGFVVDFASRPLGRLLLLGVPAVLLLFDLLRGQGGKSSRPAVTDRSSESPESRATGGRAPSLSPDAAAQGTAPPHPPLATLLANSTDDTSGLARLLESGEASLAAGNARAAQTAAEAVLSIDPRNERAWLLKSRTAADPLERAGLLRSALLVNPQARSIATELAAVESMKKSSTPGDSA